MTFNDEMKKAMDDIFDEQVEMRSKTEKMFGYKSNSFKTCYEGNYDYCEIKSSDVKVFLDKLSKKPWCQIKKVPVDE